MVAQDKCDCGSDSVTKPVFRSALYLTHYLDEKPSPDISLSLLAQGHVMSSCFLLAPGYGALRVTAGDGIPYRAWLAHGLGQAYIVVVILYESGWLRGFPTSTLIMPFFNMFKSRRARSTSLPRAPDRYLHESEVYNQASAYGPRSTGFGRSARPTQPQAGFRAQHYPSHGSSVSNSAPERYADSPTNDQVRTTACRISHPQCPEHCLFTK